ncbi:hypothetical protein J6590_051597 [Homalodisca vitripennis]|nr:hypothetical protein J6590_051597 [Homalodisca vitripennis]
MIHGKVRCGLDAPPRRCCFCYACSDMIICNEGKCHFMLHFNAACNNEYATSRRRHLLASVARKVVLDNVMDMNVFVYMLKFKIDKIKGKMPSDIGAGL